MDRDNALGARRARLRRDRAAARARRAPSALAAVEDAYARERGRRVRRADASSRAAPRLARRRRRCSSSTSAPTARASSPTRSPARAPERFARRARAAAASSKPGALRLLDRVRRRVRPAGRVRARRCRARILGELLAAARPRAAPHRGDREVRARHVLLQRRPRGSPSRARTACWSPRRATCRPTTTSPR